MFGLPGHDYLPNHEITRSVAGVWILRVHAFQGLADYAGDDGVSCGAVVGRDDVPRGVFGGGAVRHDLVGFHEFWPQQSVFQITGVELPVFMRGFQALSQSLALGFMGNIEHEFQDGGAVFRKVLLEIIDLTVAFIDFLCRRESAHLDHQNILIMGTVKHGDLAFGGADIVDAPQIVMG